MKKNTLSLVTALAVLVILGVLGFALGNMHDLLFGSPLTVNSIKDGATLKDGFLPIIGNTKHSKNISLNGRSLFVDREGNFIDGIILSPGYNVVEIATLNQFGKEKIKTYHLVLDVDESIAVVRQAESL